MVKSESGWDWPGMEAVSEVGGMSHGRIACPDTNSSSLPSRFVRIASQEGGERQCTSGKQEDGRNGTIIGCFQTPRVLCLELVKYSPSNVPPVFVKYVLVNYHTC